MNPEQLNTLAAQRIKDRPMPRVKRWHLCHWKGSLGCRAINHVNIAHPVFHTFAEDYAEAGFSSQQWARIGSRLYKHYERRPGCLQRQKP